MDRAELTALLAEVARELHSSGAVARVYVVGGAAMALAYDGDRTTRDIDGVVLDGHGPLLDAVRTVGRRHGLPSTWLNEQASAFVPPGGPGDPASSVVFDHTNLRVIAAPAEHLLVMKAHAARLADLDDLDRLCSMTGVVDLDGVLELCERVFPGQPVSERSRAVLGEWFAER